MKKPENPAQRRDLRDQVGLLSRALEAHLERLCGRGLTRTPRPTEAPPTLLSRRADPTPGAQERDPDPMPSTATAQVDAENVPPTLALAQACGDLTALRAEVSNCRACGLCETRTQTVFSDGNGSARVMFIGEAPGQNEDEQGVPFVGRAGALLGDIIQKGMGLRREDVYIANVLKCRPPGNRDPEVREKELCTPFLDRQIELLDPEVLITLGLHASQHVLKQTLSMGRLRGKVHRLGARKVIATYHPAYLLRSPGMKKECWKDIQIAMGELGLRR